jgi:hypothetical protein
MLAAHVDFDAQATALYLIAVFGKGQSPVVGKRVGGPSELGGISSDGGNYHAASCH